MHKRWHDRKPGIAPWVVWIFVLTAAPCWGQEQRFAVDGFGIFTGNTKTADLDKVEPKTKISGGAGFGYMVNERLQIRGDFTTQKWNGSFTRTGVVGICVIIGGLRICFTGTTRQTIEQQLKNSPIFGGVRYFLTTGALRPYAEGGIGINPLVFTQTVGTSTTETKKTKMGVIPGGGVEYRFSRNFAANGGVRYYFVPKELKEGDGVTPSFLAVAFGATVHF